MLLFFVKIQRYYTESVYLTILFLKWNCVNAVMFVLCTLSEYFFNVDLGLEGIGKDKK